MRYAIPLNGAKKHTSHTKILIKKLQQLFNVIPKYYKERLAPNEEDNHPEQNHGLANPEKPKR